MMQIIKIWAVYIFLVSASAFLGNNLQAQTNTFSSAGNAKLNGNNYLSGNTRTFFQYPSHVNNAYSRGLISASVYWDVVNNSWYASGGTYSDFSMLRFENNGVIGFFSRNSTGSSYSMTDAELENHRKMTILTNGNVGIGVKLPAEKLAVKGKIRAQEVKVEMANWPDYVFSKDYALTTLAETEQHIKEHGHLPGIPSAAEVEKNGVELGEMNRKLLQKIEELTLHLIEIKKELVSVKAEVKCLKSKNTL